MTPNVDKLRSGDVLKWGVRGPPQDLNENGNPVESVYFFGIIDILQPWNTKKVSLIFEQDQLVQKALIGARSINH